MAYTDTNEDEQIVPFVQDDDHSDVLSMLGLAPQPAAESEHTSGTYTKPTEDTPKAVSSDDAVSLGQIAPITSDTSYRTNSDDYQPTQNTSPRDAAPITPQIASPVQATSGPQPVTTPYDDRLKADQAKLDALKAKNSGVSNRHGIFGGILKGLDIAGSILMPHAMAVIPGTRLNYAQNVGAAQNQVAQDVAGQNSSLDQQYKQAQIIKEQQPTPDKTKAPSIIRNPVSGMIEGLDKGDGTFVSPSSKEFPTELQDIIAKETPKTKEGETPLGKDGVAQMNSAFLTRYQIMHPEAKELPATFRLPDTATQKDFDRLDKVLSSTETAYGNKQQRDRAYEEQKSQHEFMRTIAEQNRESRGEKDDMQVVVGNDANGNRVLASHGDAKKLGLTDVTKADADLQNKTEAARHWIKLADKQGDTPESMGILQLIDKMDKEGKLGTVASRWNDFMAGKVGAGDPEFTALRAKMGLANTKLMQAHVGSRGGAFMMEHFEDLANAKKMDAPTLRAGVASELDYMKDTAMLPSNAQSNTAKSPNTPPNGVPSEATGKAKGSDGLWHYHDKSGNDLGVVK
jgi:hypothetical protein